MRLRQPVFFVGIIIILFFSLTWSACSTQFGITKEVPELFTRVNTPVPLSTSTAFQVAAQTTDLPNTYTPIPTSEPTEIGIPSTLTPLPTITLPPIPTATDTPPSTLSSTAVPIIITEDGVDRTCPNPAPLKPDYYRYFVPSQSWPVPVGSSPDHFWLSHPFRGGGRLLYTTWLPYGYDAGGRYLFHNGIDLAEPLGTPIQAMADGTVVVAGDDYSRLYGWRCDWYGHLVVIELDQTLLNKPVYLVYGHVLEISVEAGQHVSQGEQVAEVGFGGAAEAPHLHIEVRIGTNEFGSTRNPLLWIQPPTTRGVLAGRIVDPQGRPWQGVAINALGKSEGTEDYTTWSYLGDPQNLANPDEVLAENFVIGDMLPGTYEIYVLLQGTEYRSEVEVTGGGISTVEIVTEPLKTATPEPVQPELPGATPDSTG